MSTVKGLLTKLFQKPAVEPASSTPLSPPSSPTTASNKIFVVQQSNNTDQKPKTKLGDAVPEAFKQHPIYERLYG